MENPTNSVVDGLALRERLVAAFVGNHPEASREKTGEKRIDGPEGKARGGVEGGVGQRNVLWGEERVEEVRGLVDSSNNNRIHHSMSRVSMAQVDTSTDAFGGGTLTCKARI